MKNLYPAFVLFLCLIPVIKGGVVANFTIVYEYVSTDEIILLQNAIEDVGFIDQMRVKPIALESDDVPPAPVNVSTKVVSSTVIELTWSPVIFAHVNYTVKGYAVYFKEYQQNVQTLWKKVTVNNPTAVSFNVTYLHPFTLYTFRVLAYHSGGNGISSSFVDEKTAEGVPQEAPRHFECVPKSPNEISMTWDFLESRLWNGFEKAYVVQYKIYGENNVTTLRLGSSVRAHILSPLNPFTRYEIYMVAESGAGLGIKKTWCTKETEEGTPSVGPLITSADLEPTRPLEAIITWNPIPDDKIHGNLIGYALYYGESKLGKNAIEFPDMQRIQFDKFTHKYLLKGLKTYSETRVVIRGITGVGEGVDSQTAYIETCICPMSIYAAWFKNEPYVSQSASGLPPTGIFPDYLEKMINDLCSSCNNTLQPKLYWDRTKSGHSPIRQNEKELKSMIDNNAHLHVAMFGRSEIEVFQSDYRYVSIISSPGIGFIVRDPLAELDRTAAIMGSLASCWPSIIIIFLLSTVAGIFVWTLDCKVNAEEFPGESFIKGIYHGAYWAFVSMTTVGYGDKTPRSFLAQVIAIIWMLMGPIINGIVVGAITTSLTSINLESDPKIYGTKVAAIAETFEYNLGVRRNAIMEGTNYTTKEQMIDDLTNRVVDGILMDSLAAADLYDEIAEKKLKISKLIPEPSGWGIILAGDLLRLEDEIRSYVKEHEKEMKVLVANATDGKLVIGAAPPSNLDTGIVDPDSQAFKDFVLYGLITWVILCILGLTFEHGYLRMRRRRIVPYSEEHRNLLQNNLATIVTDFCDELSEKIQKKSNFHDSELKKLFWKKGYSFGVDGWFRERTNNEEMLKNKIRYHEIMSKDLGLIKNKVHPFNDTRGSNAITVAPIPVKPSNFYSGSSA